MQSLPELKIISQLPRKTNDISTVVDNGGIFWLNENLIEEGLDHNNLRETTLKYLIIKIKP